MNPKRSLYLLVSGLLSAFSITAQQAENHEKTSVEFSRVVVEPKKPASVEFLKQDTLNITAAVIITADRKGKRKKHDEPFTIYTIGDGKCISLKCTVGNATIQLKHLDNLLMYDRHGQIDLVSISGEKEIRLSDIKAISITSDPY